MTSEAAFRRLEPAIDPLGDGSDLRPGRRDRVSEVYEHVRELIVRGRMAPGVRLVEAKMVERLAVSRTSVRAALQRLQQEGYVTGASGGKGRPTVAPLTSDDALELFSMVGEVEGLAAERASTLPLPVRRALVIKLTVVNQSYTEAGVTVVPDADRMYALDTQFHRLYVEAGGGPRLRQLHDAIKPQIERYIRIYQAALHGVLQTSVDEHVAIIDRIGSGDGRAAQDAVRTNWRNAAARLQSVIDARGERGNW